MVGFLGLWVLKGRAERLGRIEEGGVLEVEGWAVVPVYVAKGRSGKFHE